MSASKKIVWGFAAAASALALSLLVLQVWTLDLDIPWRYGADANFYLLVVKGLLEHGWHLENSSLGAPSGQELYDFPLSADNLNFVLLKVLGVFSSDPAVVTNLFFLLTFVLVALSGFLVFCRLGISPWTALVCALLFTFLPYHLLRGPGHLLLSAYYAVPIGAYLALSVLDGRPLLERRSRTTVVTLLLCAIVGSTGIYYAVFTLALLVVAGVIAAIAERGRRPLVEAGALVAAVLAVLVVNLAPNIVHRLREGPNPVVSARSPSETEYYSINLARLAIPLPSHRFDPAARLGEEFASTSPLPAAGEGTGYIGAVGAVGLFVLLGVLAVAAVGRRVSIARPLRQAGVLTLAAFLIGTTGGLATIYVYLVNPELHGAGRISLFIAFLSLFAVGLLLDKAARRLSALRYGVAASIGLPATVLLFGLYDQTPSPYPDQKPFIEAEWRSDDAFVSAIERRLPEGAMVFQLPHISFPHDGSVVGRLLEYDPARAYIHSHDLRWSYGVMNERAEEWQDEAAAWTTRELVRRLSAVGFSGIYVDRYGYGDNGARFERELQDVLGADPLVSHNRRLSFFDLREFAASLRRELGTAGTTRLRESTLNDVAVEWGRGFSALESGNGRTWRWADRTATLTLTNPDDTPRTVELAGTFATGPGTKGTIRVRLPDGKERPFSVSSDGLQIRVSVALEPGRNHIEFEADAPRVPTPPGDPRSLYFAIYDPKVG